MKRLFAIAILAFSSLAARSELFTFYAITSNDSSGYAQFVGESQLFMDVTLLGMGQVSLVFTNAGPEAAVISRIYFDYIPKLDLSLVAINDGDGVVFQSSKVNPGNLPAGRGLESLFISDLGVASQNPAPKLGINPSDSLELIMGYDEATDFLGAFGSEDLRIGLHVQSFEGGYSESFVNVIPEPSTLPLLFVGSLVLRWVRIKSSRKGTKTDFTPYLLDNAPETLGWVEIRNDHKQRDLPRNRCEAAIRKVTSLQA
jgi:hypothetical protein